MIQGLLWNEDSKLYLPKGANNYGRKGKEGIGADGGRAQREN